MLNPARPSMAERHKKPRPAFSTVPSTPPLVHFTTADLSNLAKDFYDVGVMSDRLAGIDAAVLITPEHLIEWHPLSPETRERHFLLIDRLPRTVFFGLRPPQTWQPASWDVRLDSLTSDQLRDIYTDGAAHPGGWIMRRRDVKRRFGDGDFFARNARLASKGKAFRFDPFNLSRLKKYHQANRKHGSDLTRPVKLAAMMARSMEAASGPLGRLVPRKLKAHIQTQAKRASTWLHSIEPSIHARHFGVTPSNRGFQLWWETRQKLWAKPFEVGGLAEQVDLSELRLWPICALITVDRRVHNAVKEALRTLGWHHGPQPAARFVKAGSQERIWRALEILEEMINSAPEASS